MVQEWHNADKLYLRYGPDKATAATAGEYRTYGQLHEWEVKIDLTTLSTSSQTVIDSFTEVPQNYRIQEVVVISETAATSAGAATLDVGLHKRNTANSTTLTAIDATAFVSAMAKTAIAANGTQVILNVGSTGAGTSIGSTLSDHGVITAKAGTATFTAGLVKVKIRAYRV